MDQSMIEELKTSSLPHRSDLHLSRKLWHMMTGGSLLFIHFINPHIPLKQWGLFTLAFAIFSFIGEYLRLNNLSVNQWVLKVFAPFLRNSEKNSLSGLPFYALGCAISLLLFNEKISILSILFLIFSDPISSLAGIMYGKDKIFGHKSIQGGVTGFAVCYIITLIYTLQYNDGSFVLIIFSLLAGVIGALSELVSGTIDDNLTIPILSGIGLTLLNKIFLMF